MRRTKELQNDIWFRKGAFMKGKRILAVVLVCALLCGQAVCAQESGDGGRNILESESTYEGTVYSGGIWEPALIELAESELPEDNSGDVELQSEQYNNEAELYFLLEQKVKEAVLSRKTELDIRGLHIPIDYFRIAYLGCFSPYFSNGIDLQFYYSAGYYVKLDISNMMSPAETENYFYDVDRKVEQILAQVNDDMSEETKALVIHDYFASQFEYDNENFVNDTLPADSFRSGGLIMNRIGVCQAYAYAYKYIMNRLGIECHVVSSSAMVHGWNIIKIDGAYYQVDCTWDDPVGDRFGLAAHKNFLVSDEVIQSEGHYDWTLMSVVGDIACTSKKYDNAYWREATSPVVLSGGNAYYVKETGIYKKNLATQEETVLKDLGWWSVWDLPGYGYPAAYSGLFLHEGWLYYNTDSEIRKISLQTNEDTTVYQPDTSAGYIYGCRIQDGVLQYSLAKEPGETEAVLAASEDVRTYPTGIVTEISSVELEVNDTMYLMYSLLPGNATARVTWNSDNPGVVSVSDRGKITAKSAGHATVTVSTDNGKTASVSVTVYNRLPFTDVAKSQWYYNPVAWAYRNQIMTGLNPTKFAPGQSVARAQFAVILHRMNGEPAVEYTKKFPDVEKGIWYAAAVLWASDMGIVTGYSNTGKFGPADSINREQMAVMMYRYAIRKGYDVSKKADFSKFKDSSRVSGFAKDAMQWAVGTGIITGKDNGTKLDPQGNASRAECATIIMRFVEKYGR